MSFMMTRQHFGTGTCHRQAAQVVTLRPDALGCCRQRKHQSQRPSLAPSRRSIATQALFGGRKKTKPVTTVVPDPSYNIPLVLGGVTGLSALQGNLALAGLTGILGAFLAFQASRVKFVFDSDSLEVVLGNEAKETENAFVGGENKWKFSTFTNWEFWWPNFPVLVYFKETQTKPEGQIHFFPIIFNSEQLYNTMVERCGSSQTSAPKE
ncbi:g2841 [Coccomyxa viridis]|uniref:G2841 protein n=1 Tax=Coccomyxa viridis TaxID=1274662 RepID=A0ABP1FLD4_9CHLO